MSAVSLNTERRKLKSGERVEYWYLRWYGSDGRRRAKCIGRTDEISKTKAQRIRLRKRADLELGPRSNLMGETPSLGAYLDNYLQQRKTEIRPLTWDTEKTTISYLKTFFGPGCQIGDITRARAREFRSVMASGKLQLSRRTMGPPGAEKHIRHAKAIFGRAVQDEIIPTNPFSRIGKLPRVDKNWPYVDGATFKRILKTCPNNDWRIFLGLCRLTALRRNESLTVTADKIRDRKLQVIAEDQWRPKDREPRLIPICRDLREILKQAPKNGKLVGQLTRWRLSKYKNILARAKVKKHHTFQDLRKSCIRDWAMRFQAHVVKQWSGHSSLDVMDRYYLQVPESEYGRGADLTML